MPWYTTSKSSRTPGCWDDGKEADGNRPSGKTPREPLNDNWGNQGTANQDVNRIMKKKDRMPGKRKVEQDGWRKQNIRQSR